MPVPEKREAVERHLLKDTAHDALCAAIVSGTLVPGEQLHDTELCSWLGLSRTPVRDALARLEEEGLVETAPQRFTRVKPLRPADAAALFPVVSALHELATRLAVARIEAADIARLREAEEAHVLALTAREPVAAYDTDDRFHDVLVRASRNEEVAGLLAHLAPRLRRLQLLGGGVLPGRRALAQHEAIIDRVARGDAGGAASAVRENWVQMGGLVERSLDACAAGRPGGGGNGAAAILGA